MVLVHLSLFHINTVLTVFSTFSVVDKNPSSTPGGSMRSVAKTIPGPSASLEQATARGVSAGQAANMALQASISSVTKKVI